MGIVSSFNSAIQGFGWSPTSGGYSSNGSRLFTPGFDDDSSSVSKRDILSIPDLRSALSATCHEYASRPWRCGNRTSVPLLDDPDPQMQGGRYLWKRKVLSEFLLYGRPFIVKRRGLGGYGRVERLEIIDGWRVSPDRQDNRTGAVVNWRINWDQGHELIPATEMIIPCDFGIEPTDHYSIGRMISASETLDTDMAIRSYLNRWYQSGGIGTVAVEMRGNRPGAISPEQKQEFETMLGAALRRTNGVIFKSGMSGGQMPPLEKLTESPSSAGIEQALQITRDGLRTALRCPAEVLGGSEITTPGQLESSLLMWTQTGLRELAGAVDTQIYEGIKKDLRGVSCLETNFSDLKTADLRTLASAIVMGRKSEAMTVNDGRRMLGLEESDDERADDLFYAGPPSLMAGRPPGDTSQEDQHGPAEQDTDADIQENSNA